jgi:putative inorganic carbon (HCO3(-)) transporter
VRTESLKQILQNRSLWIEGVGLLAATPFLLFPTQAVLGTAAALIWVAFSWLRPLFVRQRPVFPASPFNAILLLWLVMLLVGIGVTADPELTLPKATGLVLGMAVWRFLLSFIPDKNGLKVGIAGFVFWGLAFTLLGLLGINWLDKVPALSPLIGRLPAQLVRIPESVPEGVSPNQLAGTIEMPLLLVLSMLLSWQPGRGNFWNKVGITFLFIGLAGVIVLTQSRSGWVGLVGGVYISLILWGFTLKRSKKRLIIWLLVALFTAAGLGGILWAGPERIANIWNDPAQDTVIGQLGTLNFRKEVWQWGIAAVQDFPFTGTGLGTFRQVVKRLYPLNVPFDYDIAHAHNIFLQVALDSGIPGLIAYLALLFVAVRTGWWVARRDEVLRPFALGLLAGLAALHIFGLTDALAPGSKPGLLFWAALGLIAVMHRITMMQERVTAEREHGSG